MQQAIKIGSGIFDFSSNKYVMGILNRTPDSFSDGGDFNDLQTAADHALAMVAAGAAIIDVGGESSRPLSSVEVEAATAVVGLGSSNSSKETTSSYLQAPKLVSAEEELQRVIPLIQAIRQRSDIPISIDTYKAEVAEAALKAGANMINDVRGLEGDPCMAEVAARYQAPIVLMHNQSREAIAAYPSIVECVLDFFKTVIKKSLQAGIAASNIILDPGYNFGKSFEENMSLLRHFEVFQTLGFPLLIGTSRKSTLGRIVNAVPKKRLGATLASNVVAALKGASILRVHDVAEHVQAIKFLQACL